MYYFKIILALAFSYQAIAMPNHRAERHAYKPTLPAIPEDIPSDLISAQARQAGTTTIDVQGLPMQDYSLAMYGQQGAMEYHLAVMFDPVLMTNIPMVVYSHALNPLFKIGYMMQGGLSMQDPIWSKITHILPLFAKYAKDPIRHLEHVSNYQANPSNAKFKANMRAYLERFISNITFEAIAHIMYDKEMISALHTLDEEFFKHKEYIRTGMQNLTPNPMPVWIRIGQLQVLAMHLIQGAPSRLICKKAMILRCKKAIIDAGRLNIPEQIQNFRKLLKTQLEWANQFESTIARLCNVIHVDAHLTDFKYGGADVVLHFLHHFAIASQEDLIRFVQKAPALALEGLLNAAQDYVAQIP